MNSLEMYILLFTDILAENFAFNASSAGMVFDTMKIFGNYNIKFIILTAITAYMLSVGINYLFGAICYKILSPVNKDEGQLDYKIKAILRFKFTPLIIMLSFIPFFGKFIILFSGFCRIKFRLVLIISFLAKLAYYLILTFTI